MEEERKKENTAGVHTRKEAPTVYSRAQKKFLLFQLPKKRGKIIHDSLGWGRGRWGEAERRRIQKCTSSFSSLAMPLTFPAQK
jgi:hypothetical protein